MPIESIFGAKYKNISEKVAETQLKKMQKGEYLVYPDKKNPGGYIVGVKMLDGKINHYPIMARMENANQVSLFLREKQQAISAVSIFVDEVTKTQQQNKEAARQHELNEKNRKMVEIVAQQKDSIKVNEKETAAIKQHATRVNKQRELDEIKRKASVIVNEAATKVMRDHAKAANRFAVVDEPATKAMREEAGKKAVKLSVSVDTDATRTMRQKNKTIVDNLYQSLNSSTAKVFTATGVNHANAIPAQQTTSKLIDEQKPAPKPTPSKPQLSERDYTNYEIAAGLILAVAPKKLTDSEANKFSELTQARNWNVDANGNARSNVLLSENEANAYVNKLKANLPQNAPLNLVTIERHYTANMQSQFAIVMNNALLKSSLPMVQQAKSKIDTQQQKSPQQTTPAQTEKEEIREPKRQRPGR